MKFINRIFRWCTAVIAFAAVATGCVQEMEQEQGYGFVQFRLYKSASFPGTKAAGNVLDSLSEASKLKVTLRSENNKTLNPTVSIMKVDAALAEYGMQTEKFQLAKGKYKVIAYTVYNKIGENIFSGEPSSTTEITVVGGGLSVQNLSIDTRPRGFVKFRLIPQPDEELAEDIENQQPATKAMASGADKISLSHPFYSIKSVNITVQPVSGGNSETLKKLPVSHSFTKIDEKLINVCTVNSLVPLAAGEYKVISIGTTIDGNSVQTVTNVSGEFIVKDNQVTGLGDKCEDEDLRKADIYVSLSGDAAYIKDALALHQIWLDHDGPNWEKNGVQNLWNFDGDVNVWLAQPGVQVSDNGRVAVIDFTGTGVSGKLSSAIGELTGLRRLSFGSHVFVPSSSQKTISGRFDSELMEQEKNGASFIRTFYGNQSPLVEAFGCNPQMLNHMENDSGMDLRRSQGPKKTISMDGDEWATNDKPYATKVTELPEEINNLKNLQMLYISYCAMETLPEDLSGLESLTDIEIFKCYNMKKFPVGLKTLPKLISLTFSGNDNIPAEETEEGLRQINAGAAFAKTLQILQLPAQKINVMPDLTNLTRMSLLNVSQCGITKFEKAFGKNHPFVTFDASYNNLTEDTLPRDEHGFFVGLDSETNGLNFSYNKFTKLPNIFNAKSVFRPESISFAYNEIEDVETDKGEYRGLNCITLNLTGNKMQVWPESLFSTGSKISFLQLGRNEISKVSAKALEGENIKYLQVLDLSYNKLKELPKEFNSTNLHYLEQLELSYNRFAEFPYTAVNSQYMLALFFRGQRDEEGNRCMRTWPNGITTGLFRLRGLYLGSNDIGNVTDKQISSICYNLDISDNPNITIDLSTICSAYMAGRYNLIYTPGQDIRGCDVLRSNK